MLIKLSVFTSQWKLMGYEFLLPRVSTYGTRKIELSKGMKPGS